jgi:hypothetical protein
VKFNESDLRATVREQLSEIIFDSFRWEQGDYNFVAGELPTIEEITLNRGVEDLIFAGVRRVTSWSRVREGCGGLGARLVLQPEYLSVLDKMCVGSEEAGADLASRRRSRSSSSAAKACWRFPVVPDPLGASPARDRRVSLENGGRCPHGADVSPAPAPAEIATMPEWLRRPSRRWRQRRAGPETPSPRRPTPISIPVSEADDSAEIVSEPWRLAAERRPSCRS